MTDGVRLNPRPVSYNRSAHRKKFRQWRNSANQGGILVFNRLQEERDMDAEVLAKAALGTINDWLDEEIVGLESLES